MKYLILISFCILSFAAPNCRASCSESPAHDLSAEFEITAIEKTSTSCNRDETGHFLDYSVSFEAPGCVLRLKVVKMYKDEPSDIDRDTNTIYGIYQNGSLCSGTVGQRLKASLDSIITFCCGTSERYRHRNTEVISCKMTPKPTLLVPSPPAHIECSAKGVDWRARDVKLIKSKAVVK